jgi:hypothetical protein
MKNLDKLRTRVIEECCTLLEARVQAAAQAMHAAQEATLGEDKSSAGDKYETSRAMGHLDRNMNAKQMVIAKDELQVLHRLAGSERKNSVQAGALVSSTAGLYFLGAGLGSITVDGQVVITLSANSPLAAALRGKVTGDQVNFMSREITITGIC